MKRQDELSHRRRTARTSSDRPPLLRPQAAPLNGNKDIRRLDTLGVVVRLWHPCGDDFQLFCNC